MELIIFSNEEQIEAPIDYDPIKINEYMDFLATDFSDLIKNLRKLDFLQIENYGTTKD